MTRGQQIVAGFRDYSDPELQIQLAQKIDEALAVTAVSVSHYCYLPHCGYICPKHRVVRQYETVPTPLSALHLPTCNVNGCGEVLLSLCACDDKENRAEIDRLGAASREATIRADRLAELLYLESNERVLVMKRLQNAEAAARCYPGGPDEVADTIDSRRAKLPAGHLPCGGCGGPHRFDTTVPSAAWNAVIRAAGLSDFLCTTCIVEHFVTAGISFTAQLWSTEPDFYGVPIEVRVRGEVAQTAALVSEENTALRYERSQLVEERDRLRFAVIQTLGDAHQLGEVSDRSIKYCSDAIAKKPAEPTGGA